MLYTLYSTLYILHCITLHDCIEMHCIALSAQFILKELLTDSIPAKHWSHICQTPNNILNQIGWKNKTWSASKRVFVFSIVCAFKLNWLYSNPSKMGVNTRLEHLRVLGRKMRFRRKVCIFRLRLIYYPTLPPCTRLLLLFLLIFIKYFFPNFF